MASKKVNRKRGGTPPWKKPNPRKKSTKLSVKGKAAAKSRAKKAGRPYPNLVDNMHEAAKRSEGAS